MREPDNASEDEEHQRPDYVAACALAKVWTRFALIFLLPLALLSAAIPIGTGIVIVFVAVFLSDMAWDLLARRIVRRQGQTPVSLAFVFGGNLGFWGIIVVGAILGTLITQDDGWRYLVVSAIQLALFWAIPRLLVARES